MRVAQIALIEDNPGDVFLVELALQENGLTYELTRFKSGREALPVLCAPAEGSGKELTPDAILLDLNTPNSDGLAVLSKLKECPRLSHVPIAVLTSSPAKTDKHHTSLLGSRYIQKPSQLAAFVSTVGGVVKEMLAERWSSE